MSKIPYPGIDLDYDEELSFRDFIGWEFISRPEYNFSNKVIYSSCFPNETPDIEIFPKEMRGATFVKCNLMNVKVPDGNTIIDCNQQRYCVQNDLRDWEIDINNEPVKVLNEKYWIMNGYSIDPADIPISKISSTEQIRKA